MSVSVSVFVSVSVSVSVSASVSVSVTVSVSVSVSVSVYRTSKSPQIGALVHYTKAHKSETGTKMKSRAKGRRKEREEVLTST